MCVGLGFTTWLNLISKNIKITVYLSQRQPKMASHDDLNRRIQQATQRERGPGGDSSDMGAAGQMSDPQVDTPLRVLLL